MAELGSNLMSNEVPRWRGADNGYEPPDLDKFYRLYGDHIQKR